MAARRRTRFKFTERRQSVKGIVALSVAAVLVLLYVIFFFMAYNSYGGLSAYFGSFGVLAIVITIVNVVISIQSMREENSFQLIPRCAMVFTVISAILWIGTFALGFR